MSKINRLLSKANVPLTSMKSNTLSYLIIAVIVVLGILVRISSLSQWDYSPGTHSFHGKPILVNFDGYYYLDLAKHLGSVGIKPFRAYPEGVTYPNNTPLLSILIFIASKVFSVSLIEAASILPVVLSLTIAIPVYYWTKFLSGHFYALMAALLSVVFSGYANRMTFGSPDTDCLNVSFSLTIALLFFLASESNLVKEKIKYLLFAFFMAGLFFWWWDMAAIVVFYFVVIPYILSVIINSENKFCLWNLALATLGLLIITSIYPEEVNSVFNRISQTFNYISNLDKESIYPQTGEVNAEQSPLSIVSLASVTTHSTIIYGLSWLSLPILVFKRPKIFLFLFPILAIGIFTFFYGNRFKIFLIPFCAIFISYLFYNFLNIFYKKTVPTIIFLSIIIFIVAKNLDHGALREAPFTADDIAAMDSAKRLTRQDSVIYTWWDLGHPITFWSERATVADGWIHGAERTVYTTFPLHTPHQRLAANYINFYVKHGISGFKSFYKKMSLTEDQGFSFLVNLFSVGPQKAQSILESYSKKNTDSDMNILSLMSLLFPENNVPIYIYLNPRIMHTTIQRLIYWYGSWERSKKSGKQYLFPFRFNSNLFSDSDYRFINDKKLSIDLDKGIIKFPELFLQNVHLKSAKIFHPNYTEELHYQHSDVIKTESFSFNPAVKIPTKFIPLIASSGSYSLNIWPAQETALLIDSKMEQMMCRQLYYSHDDTDFGYFKKVPTESKYGQLWHVIPDSVH